jgi:hypothetical protein
MADTVISQNIDLSSWDILYADLLYVNLIPTYLWLISLKQCLSRTSVPLNKFMYKLINVKNSTSNFFYNL